MNRFKIIGMLYIVFVLNLAYTGSAAAESSDVKDGFYLGFMLIQNSMSGDFDNSKIYYTDTMIYDVPDIDSGSGFEIVAGVRMTSGAFEFGYQKTTHDTTSTIVDVGDEAIYNVIDLNFKFDVFARNPIRPYLLFGANISWITIEDSAYDSTSDSIDDETFLGYGLNLGAGVSYFIHPQVAVTGGLIARWNIYDTVEDDTLEESLNENSVGLTLGMSYTF